MRIRLRLNNILLEPGICWTSRWPYTLYANVARCPFKRSPGSFLDACSHVIVRHSWMIECRSQAVALCRHVNMQNIALNTHLHILGPLRDWSPWIRAQWVPLGKTYGSVYTFHSSASIAFMRIGLWNAAVWIPWGQWKLLRRISA